MSDGVVVRLRHYEVDPDLMGQHFDQQDMPAWDTLRIVDDRNDHLNWMHEHFADETLGRGPGARAGPRSRPAERRGLPGDAGGASTPPEGQSSPTDMTADPGPGMTTATTEEAHLAALGYSRHDFHRSMSLWSNLALGFTHLSPLVGVYSLWAYSLTLGGPPAMWWIVIVGQGQFLVALVFGEVVSHPSPAASTHGAGDCGAAGTRGSCPGCTCGP